MDLSEAVYAVTRRFSREEQFGLTNQLRRASVSIASNIAEGQGRLTAGEFAHFLGMARASTLEVQTQLELACRFRYVETQHIEAVQKQAVELCRILNAVITNLRERKSSRGKEGTSN